MRKFRIDRDPHEEGQYLYAKATHEFHPGVTILVGCNGSGKSTLLNTIKRKLEKEGTPVLSYDNQHDGGGQSKREAIWTGDIAFAANAWAASEGEEIRLNIMKQAQRLGYFILNKHADAKEVWVLMDAVDSGYSIDNIVEFKSLLDCILEENKKRTPSKDIYILISANSYEMTKNGDPYNVQLAKYVSFDSYEDYKGFVLNSRKIRDDAEKEYERYAESDTSRGDRD